MAAAMASCGLASIAGPLGSTQGNSATRISEYNGLSNQSLRIVRAGLRKHNLRRQYSSLTVQAAQRPGTRLFGRKPREEPEEEAPAFGTGIFKAFNLKKEAPQPSGTKRNTALTLASDNALGLLEGLGRGRKADPKTVFVAGATGQTGARIAQSLLRAGFSVRAGVPDLEFALALAETATQYGLLKGSESKRLNAVEFDQRDPESIARAIGNAGTVVVTLGPSEDGPKGRVDTKAAALIAEAAAVATSTNFVLVSPKGAKGGGGGFFGLFGGGGGGDDSAVIDQLASSTLNYTVIRPGGVDSEDDAVGIAVLGAGSVSANDKISKTQTASVVAAVVSNLAVAENKILEIAAKEDAPEASLVDQISAVEVDGRKAAILEAEAEAAQAEEERTMRLMVEEEQEAAARGSREAAEQAAQLEAEARALSAEEAKLSAVAARAESAAARASESVVGLASRLKGLGGSGNGFGGFSLGGGTTKVVVEEEEEVVAPPKPAFSFGSFKLPSAAKAVEEEEEEVVAPAKPAFNFSFKLPSAAKVVEEEEEAPAKPAFNFSFKLPGAAKVEEEEEEPAKPAFSFGGFGAALGGTRKISAKAAPSPKKAPPKKKPTPQRVSAKKARKQESTFYIDDDSAGSF